MFFFSQSKKLQGGKTQISYQHVNECSTLSTEPQKPGEEQAKAVSRLTVVNVCH